MNYNDEFQNIFLNLLDDDNIYELNRDILAICVDNLLNEDSKISFEFFKFFHKTKLDCQSLLKKKKKIILEELFYPNYISIDIFI